MKKMLLFIAAVAILAGCSKKDVNEETLDKWNGYSNLKSGELVRTLWAGKHDSAGYVTYGIDDDANFYATFTTVEGWEMSETHLFAGDKANMPLNKPGKPKIGKFPHKGNFSPRVTEVTYTIELINLPQAQEDGFVAAAHAVVHNTNTGGTETAWGFGDNVFSDKGWGWYTTYWYQQEENPFTILYGTEYRNDSLNLYLIDVTNGTSELILSESVGTTPTGTYDGNAFDIESGNFFFTTYPEQDLFVNPLNDNDPSFSAGTLNGVAASATFHDGNFYYVDETSNDIVQVAFNSNWQIASETVISSIPQTVTVNDIAYKSSGDYIYIVGVYQTNVQLIELTVADDSYAAITLNSNLQSDSQIAYGEDGLLYVVQGAIDDGGVVSTIHPETGVTVPVEDNEVIPVPLSDLAGGPLK